MSNRIPDMDSAKVMPYCIWHPDVATEDTYEQLALRYLSMKYNVARACAVAGYTGLYKRLNVMPDVHVAEEARECGNREIFDYIMEQPVLYNIMDDYHNQVNHASQIEARLNGDTAVRWMLDIKRTFHVSYWFTWEEEEDEIYGLSDTFNDLGYGLADKHFDLTEDECIGELTSHPRDSRMETSRLEVSLLSNPLPRDLPTVQKDLLIIAAACSGSIDRYNRLRRPYPIHGEINSVIRGIYHHTLFAKWCATQVRVLALKGVRAAINARMIMNNVIPDGDWTAEESPYQIWWPTMAIPATYQELAQRQPQLATQCLHACIYGGRRRFSAAFDAILPLSTVDEVLLEAARDCPDNYFLIELEKRLEITGAKIQALRDGDWRRCLMEFRFQSSDRLTGFLCPGTVTNGFGRIYDGIACPFEHLELNVCAPLSWHDPRYDKLGIGHLIDFRRKA